MLVKWTPYSNFETTVSDFFEKPFGWHPRWDDTNRGSLSWKPAVNVYEEKDNLFIEAQLPGVDLNDVNLSVKEQTLQIRGERKVEHEENTEGYHFREAQYGTFARTFELPTYVNSDQAKATYDKGVLTISIPKQEKAQPHSIQIEVK